jgi:hypothetical protein
MFQNISPVEGDVQDDVRKFESILFCGVTDRWSKFGKEEEDDDSNHDTDV